jgi:inositol-1,3,4-trisphosphate 5/6-kinase/inositol-tetrakisphosphate 1-kinase
MSLVFNYEGLKSLNPPLFLQEFVKQGAMIFKVYVIEDFVKRMKRNYLPDVLNEKIQSSS